MRMLLIAAAAATLAACGQTTEIAADQPPAVPAPMEEAFPAIPRDPTAGPSGTDNMTWRFNPANDPSAGTPLARLMYVSNGSEGMGINFQCEAGAVHARLWRGQQRETWPFSLQSGATRLDLDGATEGESEVIVTGTLPLSAPVLTAFRDSGDLTLIDGDERLVMDAINTQEQLAITRFFDACS